MRMSDDETVEESIEKVVNQALSKNDLADDEIKKRRPKPFRYITNEDEIKKELDVEQEKTVMIGTDKPNITVDQWKVLGFGDVQTIESVVQKHQISRKFKEK
jgi:hypothetical protein